MKQNDAIEDLFARLDGALDTSTTPEGHQARFMQKLNTKKPASPGKSSGYWKPFLAIASVILVAFLVAGIFNNPNNKTDGLASVSPEMAETQEFFTAAINQELQRLDAFESKVAKELVNDAMVQLSVLESEYAKLKDDLIESGNDKRVVYAMISNFQRRIDLLEQVVSTLEGIEQINQTNTDESTI